MMTDPLDVGDIDVQDHPSGRCTFVPILRAWKDLGFEGVEDLDRHETGLEWLGRQDYDTITKVMHPAVYEAWRAGALPSSRLVTRHYDKDFGWTVRPATLKSFGYEEFSNSVKSMDMAEWGWQAEDVRERRATDPRWFRTRHHLDQTNSIIGRELRYATGYSWKSRWNGELTIREAVGYGGMKEWSCSIVIAGDIAHLGVSQEQWAQGKYHTTLMHELLHSYSPGVSPELYGQRIEWEEGIVEGMTRMMRPALFGAQGIGGRSAISDATWERIDGTHGYNKFIRALEVARDMQGVSRQKFYTEMFVTPLYDRFDKAFSWKPEEVSGLRNLYDSFGMEEGLNLLRQYGAGDVIDSSSVFFGRGLYATERPTGMPSPGLESAFARAASTGNVTLDKALAAGGVNECFLVHHEGDGYGLWKAGVSAEDLLGVGYSGDYAYPSMAGSILHGEGTSHRNEVTAYQLSELLLPGEGLVPETVLLAMRGEEGSSQFFIENAFLQKDAEYQEGLELLRANRRRIDATIALDFIQDQHDRHHGNWIYGEDGTFYAIDNGFALWQESPEHQMGSSWLQSEARRAITQEEGTWAFNQDLLISWRDVSRSAFDEALAFRNSAEQDAAWRRFELIRSQGSLDTWSRGGKRVLTKEERESQARMEEARPSWAADMIGKWDEEAEQWVWW
ncbi:MAG: hypothetical protein KAY24_00055 [Candidatus Eisenbacteria sp.]|nr:hypothetical protein [Candidatus Eisenbacteria bacterium]